MYAVIRRWSCFLRVSDNSLLHCYDLHNTLKSIHHLITVCCALLPLTAHETDRHDMQSYTLAIIYESITLYGSLGHFPPGRIPPRTFPRPDNFPPHLGGHFPGS